MNAFVLTNILYGLIITLGVFTVIEDSKDGVIDNPTVFVFFILGILINLYLILISHNLFTFFWYILFVFLGIILCFILYYFDFWGAGDGKLVIAYSSLIPFSLVTQIRLGIIMFYLIFLANSIMPFFMVLLIKANLSFIINEKKILKGDTVFKIIQNIFSIFILIWISSAILNYLSNILGSWISSYSFVVVLLISSLMIFVYEKTNKKVYLIKDFFLNIFNKSLKFNVKSKKNYKSRKIIESQKRLRILYENIKFKNILQIILFLSAIYFQKEKVFIFYFWFEFIIYFALLSMLKNYLTNKTFKYFSKKVHILKLRPRMSLDCFIVIKEGHQEVNKFGRRSFHVDKKGIILKKEKEKQDDVCFENDLSSEDVYLLNKLYKSEFLDFNEVYIKNVVPFAPLVFLGIMLTIFLKDFVFLI